MTSFVLTEMEDLRLFLEERARAFDPTLDTSIGSTFDTLVIQPLLTRLGPDPYNTAIRDFLLGRLRNEFPDLVLQDGEPLDDYLLKPLQILLEPFRRQIQQVSNNQSMAAPETLNEREADNLAANFFARRRVGGYAVGSARLYWAAPQYAQVNPVNVMRTGSGLIFVPIENQAITADTMLFNIEDNLYYFDVIVRAEQQGSGYNIPANTLTSIEGLTSVVKVTNKRAFEEGADKETTAEFLARVEQGLTEKSLVTTRGINTRMLEVFDSIRLIQVIGYGDPEMARDILKGTSESAPYGIAGATTPNTSGAGTRYLDITGLMYLTIGGSSDFSRVSVGDRVLIYRITGSLVYDRKVTQAVSTTRVELNESVPDNMTGLYSVFMPPAGTITISDIPGGLTDPDTSVEVVSGEVHIGGMTDVFVRGGDPTQQETTIEGVLDGSPLRFGIDLESFGEDDDRPVHLTSMLTDLALIPGKDRYGATVTDHILVRQFDVSEQETPWKPTAADVGRRLQLLSGSVLGMFEILEYLGEEYFTDSTGAVHRAVRLKVSTLDEESGSTVTLTPTSPVNFSVEARYVEVASITDLVRDRDGSTVAVVGAGGNPDVPGGVNFSSAGASIGDSVVVETGDDAGIYSIRRILSWLGSNDTLVLDRDLTKSVKPSGTGDGSGLRYRIADALNVDLVSPKVTKIPIGSIFTGDDLNTVAGSVNVNVTGSTNFALAGVEADDTLEIFEGDNKGTYTIKSVTSTTAILDRAVASTSFGSEFSVYRAYTGVDRPLVRVKEIEILDSNSQPTGIKIPYGQEVDTRVKGTLANRAQGSLWESTTGVTADNGSGQLLRFEDAEVDFTDPDLDLGPGDRLNILNTVNAGHYVIAAVYATYLLVEPPASGGTEFKSISSGVHYSIGLPSAGYARIYFTSPTSVQIQTGLAGARLHTDDDTPKEFIVSRVDGYTMVPEAGSTDTPRDLRVVRNYEDISNPGEYFSLVELTDTSRPGVYELEIQEGDVLEVNQEVPFRAVRATAANLTWNGTLTVTGATANPDLRIGHYIRQTSPSVSNWFKITNIVGDNITIVNPHSYTLPTGGATPSAYSATFAEMGIFGKPAGLRTIVGSNLVSVPSGSLIDFQAMDAISGLVGQKLIIDTGSDSGEYTVDSVVSAKSLRLDRVLTSTTATIMSQGGVGTGAPARDPYFEPSGSKTNLIDATETPSNVASHFITIYEGTRRELFGTYEISQYLSLSKVELDLDPTSDIVNPNGARTLTGDQDDGATTAATAFQDADAVFQTDRVHVGDTLVITNGSSPGRFPITAVPSNTQLTVAGGLAFPQSALTYRIEATEVDDPFSWGTFNWVRTTVDTNVEQEFHVYETVPTQVQVVEVAPKRSDLNIGPNQGNITSSIRLTTATAVDFVTAGVTRGDLLEILTGPSGNVGIYSILTVASNYVEIQGATFPVTVSGVAYRIWAGVRGGERMLRVGTFSAFSGKLEPGPSLPYKIVRPDVFRLSSTVMADNFDGTLYYADVQIESLGSGDEFNLEEDQRLTFESGISVDGYKYVVENNVLTFSPYEEVSLVFDRRFLSVGNSDSPENYTEISGRNIKITYDSSVVAGLVNELLRSYFDRPMNANLLGRHFLPSYVLVTLEYGGGVSADEVGAEIEEYINKLGAEDELEVSDVEAFLTRRGANSIRHPIELVTVTHDLDRALIVNRNMDRLGGDNEVPYNGTGRISAFFAKLGDGLIVTKQ